MRKAPAGRFVCAALAILGSLWAGCGSETSSAGTGAPLPSPPPADEGRPPDDRGVFVDRAEETGLDFYHFNGMSGEYYMAEVTGVGGALFDFDFDGDLDVYLVQGTMLGPGKTLADALVEPRHPLPLAGRLYRSELAQSGELGFTDVTEEAGLAGLESYGMGVAAGDFDGDGDPDLYLTNLGSNRLLENRGDGTFADVTRRSGVDDPRWSVPATFFDYDRDGWLDLFVGNYIAADLENQKICRDFTGAQEYCGPGAYPPEPDRLWRNRGDGTFEDVTARAGIREGFGGALGVVAADLDGDGWQDLYVANDGEPNNLWMNQGDGTFRDEALLAGCSVNANGKAEASMGVDAGDFDGDGDLDLFMTHLTNETNTLFLNDGTGLFQDATIRQGLGSPSRAFTSFGTAWLDFDGDGWLDLYVASGEVKKIEALTRARDPFPLHQPNQLFRNLEGRGFEEATDRGGEVFRLSEVSRGIVVGDVDNDGDHDVLLVNNNGPVRLLINQVGQARPWLGLRLLGAPAGGRPGRDMPGRDMPGRDMPGAVAELRRPGRPTLWRRVRIDGSYASANDPRILFGLGSGGTGGGELIVRWPDGSAERWPAPAAGRYHDLYQGSGSPLEP